MDILGVACFHVVTAGRALRHSGFAFEGFQPEFIRLKTLWFVIFEKMTNHGSNP